MRVLLFLRVVVLTPYRKSMSFNCEANLTLLAHKKKFMNANANDEFLRIFNANKRRNLQLF